jgi:signal peptidase II
MNRRNLYWGVFLGAVLIDRLAKWWALGLGNGLVVNKYLNLVFAMNRGVSWGIFNGASSIGFWLLTFFIAFVILAFLLYAITEHRRETLILFEVFVLAGAVSNFCDRIYYGAVIDFIDIHINTWHWPTFNLADALIVVGVIGIIGRGLCVSRKT